MFGFLRALLIDVGKEQTLPFCLVLALEFVTLSDGGTMGVWEFFPTPIPPLFVILTG
jgi:hypothetical protein